MDTTETVAAYIGVLRHTLALAPGSDALMELEARLRPPDLTQRPPARAPGIARLRRALANLRRGAPPAETIAAFRDDLNFLRMFEQDASWGAKALDDLMANVMVAPAPRARRTRPTSAAALNVTPLRRKAPPAGDE